jgi:hypothetical protein
MIARATGAAGPADRGAPTGRPADRPLPMPRTVSVRATLPTRLIFDAELSPAAKTVGIICYAKAEPGAHAVRLSNPQLVDLSGLSRSTVLDALRELETAGWLYRLVRADHAAADHLLTLGYTSPWTGPQPRRVLVLCGCLPSPATFRLDGAARRTIEGTTGRTFRIVGADTDRRCAGPRPRRKGGL